MSVCACRNVLTVGNVCFLDKGEATACTDGEKPLCEVKLDGAHRSSAETCAEGTGVTMPNEKCSCGHSNARTACGVLGSMEQNLEADSEVTKHHAAVVWRAHKPETGG